LRLVKQDGARWIPGADFVLSRAPLLLLKLKLTDSQTALVLVEARGKPKERPCLLVSDPKGQKKETRQKDKKTKRQKRK
jgi:hypothetical protein